MGMARLKNRERRIGLIRHLVKGNGKST